MVEIKYRNLGRVDTSNFAVLIEDRVDNELILQRVIIHHLPLNEQFTEFAIPIKNKPGEHTLTVSLDSENVVDEIYEDDNMVMVNFNVLSSSIRVIAADSVKIITKYIT